MKISDIAFDMPVPSPSESPAPQASSLEELFRAVVAARPEGEAISGGGRSISFADLDDLSARIARFIRSRHYGDEAAVGVLCRRGALYLAAAFGAMRAGAVYLPMESELPTARQELMLKPVRLLIVDTASRRAAEFFQYRLPGLEDVLCIDAPDWDGGAERGGDLASTAYWESIAESGSDRGWFSDFDLNPYPPEALSDMASGLLEKSGLGHGRRRRVLDVGSGSGVVAHALASAASRYTAVELARNELDRVARLSTDATVSVHQMDALDIGLFDDETFDLIVLNGVVENFPGYVSLRKVLNTALRQLSDDGAIVVGAVRDLDRMDALRAALHAYAEASGDGSGLLRFESSAELFVPQRFFTAWAAESAVPVRVTFSPTGGGTLGQDRFDVVIEKAPDRNVSLPFRRFGTRQLPPSSAEALPASASEQAAYIVYTSGSSGNPKGVVVEHRHLLHIIRALKSFSDGCERVALVAPLSFDASIQQIAVSLFCGKPLHVLSDTERKQPSLFCESIRRNRIDLCDMTPAFFNVLVEYLAEHRQPLPVKRLLLAGEVLRPDIIRTFYAIPGNQGVVLFNVYGPTECTVDSSAFRIDYANHASYPSYPIGQALDGVVISIRDPDGRSVPETMTGEIWISGAGVSRGYRDGENPDSFLTTPEGRFYRTGDFGFIQNGLAYYRGREDQQVKIRGNRVEIGEVEKALTACPGVRQAVVVANAYRTGEGKSLAAYVVGEVDMAALRRHLERTLPSYCVPDYFVPMVELPLSVNRKVDKKSLPSPLGRVEPAQGRKPTGAVEDKLAELWKRLLGSDVTDAEASFFTLGGHSIMAVRLIAMIETEMNVHVSVNELFSHPSIAALAALLAGKRAAQEGPVIRLCQCDGGKTLFLFHPVGGSVFCYSDLANLLKHRYTVYAVEAAGFREEKNVLNTELHTVESLAEYYLDEILKVESGEVVFGGWSFGGLLAYEVACRLKAMGGSPGPVLILDSVADNSRARKIAAQDDISMLKTLLHDTLAFDEEVLRALPREEKLAYLVQCGESSGVLPAGFSAVQMDNLLQTYRGNAIAAARYDNPTPSDLPILLVRALDFASNPQIVIDDQYQGWSRFLKEDQITLKWVEGTHETMLSSGLVGPVATHILDYVR